MTVKKIIVLYSFIMLCSITYASNPAASPAQDSPQGLETNADDNIPPLNNINDSLPLPNNSSSEIPAKISNEDASGTSSPVDSFVGEIPLKISWLVQQFKESLMLPSANRLLLYGAPGNGKTTLARRIARLTDSLLLEYSGPSIADPYAGSGTKKTGSLFELAQFIAHEEKKKVIIFIDDIDAIANQHKSEHKASLQIELDKCKNSPNILIIFATNDIASLDKHFIERLGGNCIEVQYPNDSLRKELIEHYAIKTSIPMTQEQTAHICQATAGLSVRSIESLMNDIYASIALSQEKIFTPAIMHASIERIKMNFKKEDGQEKIDTKFRTDVSVGTGDLIGDLPLKISWLIKNFKDEQPVAKNMLMLYGPPGNGKTTLARKIAHMTNSEFLEQPAPSMIDRFVGSGSEKISALFEAAHAIIKKEKRKVIIFIDEIDAIASNNKTEFRSEHKLTLQHLWIELDKCKNNPNILVIFATNHFSSLEKPFLDRLGGNTFEVKNPDETLRKNLIEHYAKKAGLVLDAKQIAKLTKETAGLSARSIEDLINDTHMTLELAKDATIPLVTPKHSLDKTTVMLATLATIKSKFKGNDDDQEKEKFWQKIHTRLSIVTMSISLATNCYQIWNALASRMPSFKLLSLPQNIPLL